MPQVISPPFDHAPRSRIVYGPGVVDRLGELAADLAMREVVLVTDKGVAAAGHVDRAEASLRAAGVRSRRFEDVPMNPTSSDVERALAFARDEAVDGFVGFGGGSSIDTAKGCAFLLANGGAMEDYWGYGKATTPLAPLIAVPTTAGTGTEVQSFTLIERDGDHQKMACGDPSCAPRIALLDPELTVTQPEWVTAATGMDTLTHAVESYVTRKGNAVSSMYAREAFGAAFRAFPVVLSAPGDVEARGSMLRAAAFAGLAIENSMLGAAHSLANPLTAHFELSHGEAVGRMLPHVIRFNAGDAATAARYADLAREAELGNHDAEALAHEVERLLGLAGLDGGLGERHGVSADALPALANEASRQWTAQFNPRDVGEAELLGLYRRAMRSA